MKRQFPLLAALLVSTSAAFAGSFGPGPWANGAYYPGQLDGKYTANVFPANESATEIATLSGVIGFALRDGSPATQTNLLSASDVSVGDSSSATTLDAIQLDSSLNYFIIYVNGDSFAGQTAAGANIDTKKITGGLFNGFGRSQFERVTNTVLLGTNSAGNNVFGFTTQIITVPGATAEGSFSGNILADKALFTFSGPGEISVRNSAASGSTNTNSTIFNFIANGIKVSDSTTSAYSTGTAAQ